MGTPFKLFAIEGPSYVGKTSLCEQLSKENPDFVTVPELSVFADGAHNFPDVPTSKKQAKQSAVYFLELEIRRQKFVETNMEWS